MAQVKKLAALQELLASGRGLNSKAKNADSSFYSKNPYWERSSSHLRFPMAVTSKSWLSQNKFISLYVNPKDITWSIGKRETITKTAAGAIRNSWRNRHRGTYYDEPMLNITFQTGNIMPGSGVPDHLFGQRNVDSSLVYVGDQAYSVPRNTRQGEYTDALASIFNSPPIPPGLQNFYDFMGLVDQPSLLSANVENRHILFYRTRVFPRMRIEGYFTGDPINFTETSDGNANRLEWTATFMVYKTSPKFWSSDELRNVFMDEARLSMMPEILPKDFNSDEFLRYYKEDRKIDLQDPNLPYKALKTDSGQRSNKKAAGLIDPKSTAKGTKSSFKLPANPEDPDSFTLAMLDQSLNVAYQFEPAEGTGNLMETTYGPKLKAFLQKTLIDPDADPPPTLAQAYEKILMWLKSELPTEMQEAYSPLITYYQNKVDGRS